MSAPEREPAEPRDASRTADKAQLALYYYHQMLAIRRMEEALAKAYALRKFGAFLHLYIGQEAVAVGALAALKPEDYVIATYREHAHAYAKGMSAKSIIAELFGKATGRWRRPTRSPPTASRPRWSTRAPSARSTRSCWSNRSRRPAAA
jgi:pyruvate dehydrogenase E1 component alpha subunit